MVEETKAESINNFNELQEKLGELSVDVWLLQLRQLNFHPRPLSDDLNALRADTFKSLEEHMNLSSSETSYLQLTLSNDLKLNNADKKFPQNYAELKSFLKTRKDKITSSLEQLQTLRPISRPLSDTEIDVQEGAYQVLTDQANLSPRDVDYLRKMQEIDVTSYGKPETTKRRLPKNLTELEQVLQERREQIDTDLATLRLVTKKEEVTVDSKNRVNRAFKRLQKNLPKEDVVHLEKLLNYDHHRYNIPPPKKPDSKPRVKKEEYAFLVPENLTALEASFERKSISTTPSLHGKKLKSPVRSASFSDTVSLRDIDNKDDQKQLYEPDKLRKGKVSEDKRRLNRLNDDQLKKLNADWKERYKEQIKIVESIEERLKSEKQDLKVIEEEIERTSPRLEGKEPILNPSHSTTIELGNNQTKVSNLEAEIATAIREMKEDIESVKSVTDKLDTMSVISNFSTTSNRSSNFEEFENSKVYEHSSLYERLERFNLHQLSKELAPSREKITVEADTCVGYITQTLQKGLDQKGFFIVHDKEREALIFIPEKRVDESRRKDLKVKAVNLTVQSDLYISYPRFSCQPTHELSQSSSAKNVSKPKR